MKRKIYLASSWRNALQPAVLEDLRRAGHEVYDFRNPAEGDTGFSWKQMNLVLNCAPAAFIEAIYTSPIAQAGFKLDKDALDWCDTCVCLLPCGRSAHLEAGYCVGQGKPTYFFIPTREGFEPELMYLLGAGCATTIDQLLSRLELPI